MKIDDVQKITASALPDFGKNQEKLHEYLRSLGIDPSNMYQELEMSSQYVNTHRDVTYAPNPVSLHSHTYVEILYCHSSGGVEYLVGSDRYVLEKGDVILIPPGTSHRPIMPETMTEPYVRDVLWVNADFLQSLKAVFPHSPDSELTPSTLLRTAGTRWEFLSDLFQSGVAEEEAKQAGWEAIVMGNSLKILSYLGRAYADHRENIQTAEKKDLLDQVTAYIEAHYAEHMTVAELAHRFYVSESSISHHFKQKMGISIYHYVTQRRLISAKNLIAKGAPLESVATQVGFSDYSAFYRAFKHEYGISPRQYRNLQEAGK